MFTKIVVLQEFSNNGVPYGLYWAHYESDNKNKWLLIAKNRENIQAYHHFNNKQPWECLEFMPKKLEECFINKLESGKDIVHIFDFV